MLRHADPFAHYTGAQLLRVYDYFTTATGTPGTIATGPYGRSGGSAVRLSGNFSDGFGRDNTGAAGATAIVEADFRVSAVPPQDNVILGIVDTGTFQCSLVLTTALQIAVYRGLAIGGVLLGTLTSYTLTLGTYVHLSWKVIIGNSGSSELQIWEDADTTPSATLSLSAVDTQVSASAQWDGFHFGAGCNGDTDWAHVVVLDGSGSFLHDLLGPVDVWALRASARVAAAPQAWTPASGTSHAALLGDGTPDDDVGYTSTSVPGLTELVAVDPVPFPDRDILGMQLYACARRTDASAPTVAAVAQEGGTDYAASAVAPGVDFAYVMQPHSRMPSGSVFSAAAFDALTWGLEKVS